MPSVLHTIMQTTKNKIEKNNNYIVHDDVYYYKPISYKCTTSTIYCSVVIIICLFFPAHYVQGDFLITIHRMTLKI